MQSLAIFVDVQNVYYTTRQAYARHFDYRRFWNRVTAGYQLTRALAYATERGDDRQQQFQDILRGIGFEVRLRPYLQRRDGSAKADWDVGITLDVIETAPDVDRIVLVSGDGDFDLLVDRCRERFGTPVEVYGVPGLTAASLIESAAVFHPIDETLLLPKRD